MIRTYHFTFAHDHPLSHGWIEILAEDEITARWAMVELFGRKWGACYGVPPPKEHFPDGRYGHPVQAALWAKPQ